MTVTTSPRSAGSPTRPGTSAASHHPATSTACTTRRRHRHLVARVRDRRHAQRIERAALLRLTPSQRSAGGVESALGWPTALTGSGSACSVRSRRGWKAARSRSRSAAAGAARGAGADRGGASSPRTVWSTSCGARTCPRTRAARCKCTSRACARVWPTRAPTAAGCSPGRADTCSTCALASATSTAGARRSNARGTRARPATRARRGTAIEEALGVWRGDALAGVRGNELIEAERARLEEERLAAVVEGIEIDLELGRHGELLGRLEALVAANPFKEGLVELQMLALYRCGRQADALSAFQAARRRFVDELGIEPSQSLRDGARRRPDARRSTRASLRGARRPRGADAAERDDRPRGGDRCGRRAAACGRAARDAHRAGRRRQDADRPGGRRGPSGRTTPTACTWCRSPRCEGPEEVQAAIVEALEILVLSGESGECGRWALPGGQARAAGARQRRTGWWTSRPYLGELLATCPSLAILATGPRAARPAGRGAPPRAGAGARGRRRRAVLRARAGPRARHSIPSDGIARRGDLPARRRAAAGDRARGRPLHAADAGGDRGAARVRAGGARRRRSRRARAPAAR